MGSVNSMPYTCVESGMLIFYLRFVTTTRFVCYKCLKKYQYYRSRLIKFNMIFQSIQIKSNVFIWNGITQKQRMPHQQTTEKIICNDV
jgi:hypothetical protein